MRRSAIVLGALLGLILGVPPAPSPATAIADPETPGLFNPATGEWHLWDPLRGEVSFYYGNSGDDPFVGDWDCDGIETPGLYRRSDGYVYLRNSNTQGIADLSFFFGNPGDVPLAGDFDGDGCDSVSLYRPSEGRVFVINRLGTGGAGLGAADLAYLFGNPGDVPFVGDFDGDGIDTIGLHRQSTGRVYFRNSHTTGIADHDFVYGDSGDQVVAGDWTGDGEDTVGLFRPTASRFYLRFSNTAGNADATIPVDGPTTPMMPFAGAVGRTGMVSFPEFPCATEGYAGPFARVATSPEPTGVSQATGVLGMSFQSSPLCDRAVITLGQADGGPFWETAVPSQLVPAGIEVTVEGHRVNVRLDGISDPEIGRSPFLTGPTAVLVQEIGGSDRYVDLHYAQYRKARAFFLSSPARIVVDSIPSATPPGLRLGPVVSDSVILRDPIDQGQPLTPPIHVVGYASLFEGDDVATLSLVGGSEPVVAEWTGCRPEFVVPPGSGCVYSAGSLGFGEFRFTIADVAPGTYDLFVAFTSPADGVPATGVTERFTVGASAPAICAPDLLLPPVRAAVEVPGTSTVSEVDVANCRGGYARVYAWARMPPGTPSQLHQVFLHHTGATWQVLATGLDISCPLDTTFVPPELETACEALGLR